MTETTDPAADSGPPPKIRRASRHARYLAQSITLEETGVSQFTRMVMMVACAVVIIFLAWAAVTRVDEVAVAHGEVVPSGSVRIVQHLEGGIIADILVEEGALAAAGDPLMRLESANAAADLEQMRARRADLRLRTERLRAFATGRKPDFDSVSDPTFAQLIDDQRAIHQGQVDSQQAQRAVLGTMIEQRRAELAMSEQQQEAVGEQLAIFEEQVEIRARLVEQGLDSRMAYLETRRQQAQMFGELQRLMGEMAATQEALAEAETRLIDLDATARHEALDEMGTLGAELAQVEEAIVRAEDQVHRLDVRAPVRGLVQDLQFQTIGAVVRPGGVLMSIVPVDDVLEVEARVSTSDVGHVRVGQPVAVKVSTYDFARYGAIEGTLRTVSPSTFTDDEGTPYYKALITLAKSHLGEVPARAPVLPGMTVQADVVTGKKTVLQYLLKPIYVGLDRAMRER